MKTGRNLQDLLKEVIRQQEVKRDYVADTRVVDMRTREEDGKPTVKLEFGEQSLGITKLGHDQIGGHCSIPAKYYDRMLAESPRLLAQNVNYWLKSQPEKRMLRTLDGRCRAFLSDRYRALDNADLVEAALPRLLDMGVMVASCEVTDTRLYIKAIDERIKQDLPVGWTPNNRGHQQFDTCSPAIVISNSEVGDGSLQVLTSVYFGGCTNLTVLKERSKRHYHVGQRHDLGSDVHMLLSNTTRRLKDAALWSELQDVVVAAFDRAKFDATCAKFRAAAEDKIEADVPTVVEITARNYGLNEGERKSVLHHLIQTGDLSRYGLHNAVTRAAQDLDDYDRASQFERLGGELIELPKTDWTSIIRAAEREVKKAA